MFLFLIGMKLYKKNYKVRVNQVSTLEWNMQAHTRDCDQNLFRPSSQLTSSQQTHMELKAETEKEGARRGSWLLCLDQGWVPLYSKVWTGTS